MSNDIHKRLKQARIHAGYGSAIAFANAHGLTESTYASHENGGRGITLRSAKKYANLLGINEIWLLTGDGTMASEGFAEAALHSFDYPKHAKPAVRTNASERSLHKTALSISMEVLENKQGSATFEEANDLAWRMVDSIRQWRCGDDKLNAELAEWLLTWND